jgi:hypothetical protein
LLEGGRVIKRLSVVLCAALACFIAVPAQAAPLVGALVSAAGLVGTAGSLVTGLLTVGLGVGLQLISASLRPKQKARAPSGYEADVRLGGDIYQIGLFGRGATKGHYTYANTSGAANGRLDQVYVVSTGWCDALEDILLDGESLTLTETDSGTGWTKYAVTLPDDGGTRRMWATFWDGRPDQAANPTLVASADPSARWTSIHRGRGQAYVHIEADFVSTLESLSGLMNGNLLTFVVRGLRLYDPRKDTTAGGSGACRFDDPSTWEWSDNPAVCLYNYMAGIHVNGQRVLGMARPLYRLILSLFMAAANACDETVSKPGGGTEPRYRLSLFVDDGQPHSVAVERMVAAMAGQRIERPGYYGVQAGVAQVPVATITDDDLSADVALSHSNNRSFFDMSNEVWGQFLDPTSGWQPQDYPSIIGNAAMKTADGGSTLPVELDCTQMPSGSQAQRCAEIALNRNRHERSARIPAGLRWWRIEPGDWIVWNSARYGNATYEVVDRAPDMERQLIMLSLQEISSSVFTEGDVTAVPLPPTPPATPTRPTNVSGLLVQATTISGTDGQAVPGLAVSWDAVADETIRTVELEYRVASEDDSGEITRVTVPRPAEGAWTGTTISGGLMAATDYEVRSTITTFPARRVTYSTWSTVTTAAGSFVAGSAGALYDAATDTVKSAGDTISDLSTSIYDQLYRITTEEDRRGRETDVMIRETDAARASFVQVRELVTTSNSALATAIEGVEASVGDVSAGGFYRLQASVGPLPGDVSSEFTVALNAGTEGSEDWQTAGFSWQILSGGLGSRAVLEADQVVIRNGPDISALFQDGTTFLNTAVIPTLTADKITALQVVGPTQLLEIDTITPFIRMRAPTP